MTATRIDGKALALKVRAEVAEDVRAWGGPVCLATILVGDDPASHTYVGSKHKASRGGGDRLARPPLPFGHARERGPRAHRRPERGRRRRRDPRAAPAARRTWTSRRYCARSTRRRTSTGSIPRTPGSLFLGEPFLVPATPSGVMVMLAEHGVELAGKEAVVIGRSEIVGKPMAMLLLAEHATVTICHSRTADLAAHTRRADVLVAAVGRRGLVTPDMVKAGCDGDRRRRQPHGGGKARRRRRSGRLRGRRAHDTGAGRRRADDDRDASAQHAHSRATSARAGCIGRFLGASVPRVQTIASVARPASTL